MSAIGARSVMAIALASGAAIALWQAGTLRADYWEQLSPWVPFLVGAFALLAGTLVVAFWRLAEASEYYFRFGERLPFSGEVSLGAVRGRSLLIGHASQIEVRELPAWLVRAIYVATFSCVGLVAITNRAVALIREVPDHFARRGADTCAEPEAATPEQQATPPGCKLVQRAYELGYVKDLGACSPERRRSPDGPAKTVCRRRQPDEPYLHYAWRLLDERGGALLEGGDQPSVWQRLGDQLDHLGTLVQATADAIAMQPRSSHHLFTNLPDPRAGVLDRVRAVLSRDECGARLARLPHFPRMAADETGPSRLLEHVVAQLLFNAAYRPVIAECREVVVHWDTPRDACARLASDPEDFLSEADALASVTNVLDARRRKARLAELGVRPQPGPIAPAQRVVSFQCLVVGEPTDATAPIERKAVLAGEAFAIREARMAGLAGDDASQIRLYKQLAALFAEGFGYGRFTSSQAIGAQPEETTIAATFGDPAMRLTKLDQLRDVDLFLGNEWLVKRPELLDVYPYHLHLRAFIEIFRRQYGQHRGRL